MNKDKLDIIFNMQESFDNSLIAKRGLQDISMEEWMQKEVLAMISELAELLDEVNFKWWKNKKPVEPEKVKEELIDILHFFVSMCIKAGMDSKEVFTRYIQKNKENFDRQDGISKKQGYVFNGAEEE